MKSVILCEDVHVRFPYRWGHRLSLFELGLYTGFSLKLLYICTGTISLSVCKKLNDSVVKYLYAFIKVSSSRPAVERFT